MLELFCGRVVELRANLRHIMRRDVLVRISLLPQRFDLLQFFPAQVVHAALKFGFKHALGSFSILLVKESSIFVSGHASEESIRTEDPGQSRKHSSTRTRAACGSTGRSRDRNFAGPLAA